MSRIKTPHSLVDEMIRGFRPFDPTFMYAQPSFGHVKPTFVGMDMGGKDATAYQDNPVQDRAWETTTAFLKAIAGATTLPRFAEVLSAHRNAYRLLRQVRPDLAEAVAQAAIRRREDLERGRK